MDSIDAGQIFKCLIEVSACPMTDGSKSIPATPVRGSFFEVFRWKWGRALIKCPAMSFDPVLSSVSKTEEAPFPVRSTSS